MNKKFLIVMAVGFGIMGFVMINQNTDICLTCDTWDNYRASKSQTEPFDPSGCKYGVMHEFELIEEHCITESELEYIRTIHPDIPDLEYDESMITLEVALEDYLESVKEFNNRGS